MIRELSFNLFEMNTVGHISHGMWRSPQSTRHRYTDLEFWQERAALAEAGLFDTIFLADVIGAYDGYRGGPETALREAVQIPNNDPLLVIPAMAAVTKHLGFVATFSTTYEPPFTFARRASTLDHLTKGRFGWNVVTSYLPNAARNFGLDDELDHAQRYARAHEYLDVLYKLWEGSWDDDAVVRDAAAGVYTDPGKVRRIDHSGEYFRVAGPHLSEPSLQRTPVIFQAGSSATGRAVAAKHAEVVFVGGSSIEDFAASIADIHRGAEAAGRGPGAVRTLGSAVLIPGKTRAHAEAKAAQYQRLSSAEGYLAHAGGGSGIDLAAYPPETLISEIIASGLVGHDAATAARYTPGTTVADALRETTRFDRGPFFALGTGEEIADAIEGWVRETGIDGFNLRQFVTPGTLEDFVEYVVPELQKRGLYRTEYAHSTLRENLFGAGHPRLPEGHHGARYRGGQNL
ncbi:FMN-dependent oxidoreductase (nitrilotriacetate monooxygenase family) [Glaciihabitans tibetensis]|uniref:FMN-dependent oxidoreductase (Nitrilotriacetate monooxygenase family) n=1 Tax=Glaciihabitans tibetensis TaxID=1266600 RepID=A0A2T0VJQ1_9MICO|nr:LLM class flavin-dependent oxidoreductase [Glaciihabitans tibetensis]PRY70419.1 FMN-dependent oxidoreductase (nitrilotriacetate monooxygenase family) [Glaciihabitans tibetensis]